MDQIKKLVAVLACDYGTDGHSLGAHSIARLDKALQEFAAFQAQTLFVFSAGRLSAENSRLCDLQAEYVRSRGFKAVTPQDGVLIWGSKAELQYIYLQQRYCPWAEIFVVTHDYHTNRVSAIAERKVGLRGVIFIKASTQETKPSKRAIAHEWLGLIEAYVPDWVMAVPKRIRRFTLRLRIIKY